MEINELTRIIESNLQGPRVVPGTTLVVYDSFFNINRQRITPWFERTVWVHAGDLRVKQASRVIYYDGEAAYGNVGSGARLDFTVIGRDVNLASRVARLNRTLGEPILMTKPFVDFLWDMPEPLGEHALDGFAEPMGVYRPARPPAA